MVSRHSNHILGFIGKFPPMRSSLLQTKQYRLLTLRHDMDQFSEKWHKSQQNAFNFEINFNT